MLAGAIVSLTADGFSGLAWAQNAAAPAIAPPVAGPFLIPGDPSRPVAAPPALPNASGPANPLDAVAPAAAPAINILILAIDAADLTSPPAANPNLATPVAPMNPGAPIVPLPELAPSITPANFWSPLMGAPRWETSAKKSKKDKDKDADLFKLQPEPPNTSYPRSGQTGPAPTGQNPVAPSAPMPQPAPVVAPPAAVPEAPDTTSDALPLGFMTGTFSSAPQSRSGAAAAALRRALKRAGFDDVLDTALDGPPVLRAVNGRRLTRRALDQLQSAVAQVVTLVAKAPPAAPALARTNAAPAPASEAVPLLNEAVLRPLGIAAARLGQTLGYRAVVVLTVLPQADVVVGAASPATGVAPTRKTATYSLLVVDSARAQTEPLVFDEAAADDLSLNEVAASTSTSTILNNLRDWPAQSAQEKTLLAADLLAQARTSVAAGKNDDAQDQLNQALALNPTLAQAQAMLGDLLSSSDPAGAAIAYQRAVATNTADGETWGKIAVSYTLSSLPDKWPRALEAGNQALRLNFDTPSLRIAMAQSEFGRAELFHRANRSEQADNAEAAARAHLDRAFAMEPENPAVARVMAQSLVVQGRYREAVQALDRLAPQFPDDPIIQNQYALALTGIGGRDEDAFVAWARFWKLNGQASVPVDAAGYRRLSEGFDRRMNNLGQSAARLSQSVAAGAISREQALLQLTRLKEDSSDAVAAIKIIQPAPNSPDAQAHLTRAFSADLIDQALEAHRVYLETGQDIYRTRALELNRQAIVNLNMVRTGRG